MDTLWKETNIGKILPWDDIEEEAEELIQRQPKRTGGSRIEERVNKKRTGAGITLCTGYGNDDRPFIVLTETKFSYRHIPYAPILHKGRARQMGTKVDGTWQQKCSKD